jgi:hypothetical protein
MDGRHTRVGLHHEVYALIPANGAPILLDTLDGAHDFHFAGGIVLGRVLPRSAAEQQHPEEES